MKTIGIIGFGNINQEVARQAIASSKIEIKWILDRSPTKKAKREARQQLEKSLGKKLRFIKSKDNLSSKTDKVDVIVEATGAIGAIEYLRFKRKELKWGNDVLFVTANKAMVANHLSEFFGSSNNDVRIEAAVAAGLPLIRSLSEHIVSDEVQGMVGILNGTTNFMLDEMEKSIDAGNNQTYDMVLNESIQRGYAEPGGAGDVDGQDAAYKLQILSRIAFGTDVFPNKNLIRGIDDNEIFDRVRTVDFIYANKYLESTIRLVAIAQSTSKAQPFFLVHPMLVPKSSNIANIKGPDNYIGIYSKYLVYTDMQGKGAGPEPTACAMLADVFSHKSCTDNTNEKQVIKAFRDSNDVYFSRWMVRGSCYDRPGVLAHIFRHFENKGINIDEVFQLQVGETGREWSKKELNFGKEQKKILPFAFTVTKTSLGQLHKTLSKLKLDNNFFPKRDKLFAFYPLLELKFAENGVQKFMIEE
ncbi:homoserine dehydrogenase [Thiotrichales bacterium HSG1]|nr:homoserine dehydrogenase [Thiotrichales bacterium HSG1]